jgi:PHD/YefM family antitoxin component YafN of YafNO toxin-antitoxin module
VQVIMRASQGPVVKVGNMFSQMFQVLDAGEAQAMLKELHEQVARHHGRVVITRSGSDARCVLISADELSALERALEILSGTKDGFEMRAKLQQIVASLSDGGARLSA